MKERMTHETSHNRYFDDGCSPAYSFDCHGCYTPDACYSRARNRDASIRCKDFCSQSDAYAGTNQKAFQTNSYQGPGNTYAGTCKKALQTNSYQGPGNAHTQTYQAPGCVSDQWSPTDGQHFYHETYAEASRHHSSDQTAERCSNPSKDVCARGTEDQQTDCHQGAFHYPCNRYACIYDQDDQQRFFSWI